MLGRHKLDNTLLTCDQGNFNQIEKWIELKLNHVETQVRIKSFVERVFSRPGVFFSWGG